MNKFVKVVAASALVLSLGVTGVMAESAKATASVSAVNIIESEATSWTKILENNIRTSSNRTLLIDASLECGLYTDTEVKSKGGDKDTSEAEASVQVRIVVDGDPVGPEIVFCSRKQTLSATFQGLLDGCLDSEGNVNLADDSCLEPEELQLVLNTMNANSFNFIVADLGTGDHIIAVESKIVTSTDANAGTAGANATIGNGSVTIEAVRMVKDENIEF